jgi:hypothetical protein
MTRLKFYRRIKEKLNHELYRIHLKGAKEWDGVWHTIHDSIHVLISQAMEKKSRIMDKKINKLVHEQTNLIITWGSTPE